MDICAYNRKAWDNQVEQGNPWTVPVNPQVTTAAREGEWSVLLTPTKSVPRNWFPELRNADVLCLACGGGQQGPIFAAAGARVTVFDNSPRQLEQDRSVANRDGLILTTIEGDMRDLSAFQAESFDLIFHPVSNCFCPEVIPVWREAYRVLRKGGVLLAGFNNPIRYIFDYPLIEKGQLQVRYSLPYSDMASLNQEDLRAYLDSGNPLEYSHTLTEQIGGQLDAGFALAGFYEDIEPGEILAEYFPSYIATRSIKI